MSADDMIEYSEQRVQRTRDAYIRAVDALVHALERKNGIDNPPHRTVPYDRALAASICTPSELDGLDRVVAQMERQRAAHVG